MTRLFIQLYLDEDVDVLVGELLQARGFDALTTREAEQLGQSDAGQMAYAVCEERTVLTHNRSHFERLAEAYYDQNRDHWGIIIAVRRPPHQIVRRLLKILDHVTAEEMVNQIRYI